MDDGTGMGLDPVRLLLFAMWEAMMVGMMLPSAAPTLLLYAVVIRKSQDSAARHFVSMRSPAGTSRCGPCSVPR